jgi:cobalamin biosynthesis Mg chelatase CobN
MLLAASALAQANTCDEFKAVLAARIESSGVRGYSLETVKAGTPVPPDAKIIGTCESGARNVLYRRWGAARAAPASASASAAEPASAVRATATPIEPNRRVPGAPVERAVRSSPASAPNAAPPPVSPSTQAALVAPAPVRAPEKPLPGGTGEAEAGRAVDRAAAPPALASAGSAVRVKAPLAQQASEVIAENWRWLGALVLLTVVVLVWVWRNYFSPYDKAGLPRGPRL